ncbi:MAG: two-component system, OmpR family, sensor kinase [Thermotogaceae bacterium]|nr:two-component system, OmpR family, sensor kinase [Thermotogaceae bacterium]MDN5337116.1 two-component system, OmpR family, sensor kinase [Thermotogaceae bacterium]
MTEKTISYSEKLLIVMSSFTKNMMSVKTSLDVYNALLKTLNNLVEIKNFAYLRYNETLENKLEFISLSDDLSIDENEFYDLALWIIKRGLPGIQSIGKSNFLFIPLNKNPKILGLLVVELSNSVDSIRQEDIDIFNFLKFQTSMVLESVSLYEQLQKKNEILENLYEYMQTILDSMDYEIAVYDKGLKTTFENKKFKTSQKLSEEVVNTIKKLVSKTLETSESQILEFEDLADGKSVFYSITTFPVYFNFQDQVMVILRDITSSHELDRLRKIDEMKNQFIATISHELKTPIAAIKAYSETIIDSIDELDSETLSSFLKTILEQSEHLEQLVSELTDFSKMESEMFELNKEEFDITKLCKDLIVSLQEFASSRGVELIFEETQPVTVEADKNRIRQVLTNLIENGIKYSDKNKNKRFVKVSLERNENEITVIVEDNGIGIPEDLKEKIFERFFRVNSYLTNEVSGTGLGLAICKTIVEKHAGRIWVESKPNDGSKFFFTIPVRGD